MQVNIMCSCEGDGAYIYLDFKNLTCLLSTAVSRSSVNIGSIHVVYHMGDGKLRQN